MAKDRCELCALQVRFKHPPVGEDKPEDFIKALRKFQEENKIIEGYGRKLTMGGREDTSDMCAVNSEYFTGKEKKDAMCPDFILNMNLATSDAMALHTAKSTDSLTRNIHHMTIAVLFLTFLAVVVSSFSIYQSLNTPKSQTPKQPLPTQGVAQTSPPSKSP